MYGKFFSSTFTGSMYGGGSDLFAVWGYVIANTVDGAVELNPAHLAAIIGTGQDKVKAAIEQLCAADPQSRSAREDGRRLVREGQFQYRVVNHDAYRAVRNGDDRREYMRKYMADYRVNNVNTGKHGTVNSVNHSKPQLAHTDTESETETELREEHYPTGSGGTAETAAPPAEPKKSVHCPHTELLALWQQHLPMAPQPKILTETRRRQLRSRWLEHPDLVWWGRLLAYIAKSKFLTGQIQNRDRVPFLVTLDWLIKPANFAKVIEGQYHREAA